MNISVLYPDRCPQCDQSRPVNQLGFCPECLGKFHYITEPVCFRCGRPVISREIFCAECANTKHEFEAGRFLFAYNEIADSIYRFKYMNRPSYATGYAIEIDRHLSEWLRDINPDALVPVPLHKKRLISRGYNQAEELAVKLSELTGIRVFPNLLIRTRNTVPQKLYDRKRRQLNVKKAFIVVENVVKLNVVVVIDDIFTTGSTIDAVAAELKANGVQKVFFLTISAAGT